MLNLHRLDTIRCTTALEVELLAALVRERRLRHMTAAKRPTRLRFLPPGDSSLAAEQTAACTASVKQIQQAVSRRFAIPVNEIKSDRRGKATVAARHAAVLLCYILTPCSYPELGRLFGDRDHTTILHAVNKLHWLTIELTKKLNREAPLSMWAELAFDRITQKPAKDLPESISVVV
jgi:hypothetical protein